MNDDCPRNGLKLELELQRNHVEGRLGGQPVSLDVLPESHGVRVVGRFAARAIVLDLGPGAVTGAIGPCLYRLRLQQAEYVGTATRGVQSDPVQLRVPVVLIARDPVECTGMLIAFLAR